MKRRDFIRGACVASLGLIATRCAQDADTIEAVAVSDTTVLDALTKNGHSITLVAKMVDGRSANYAIAIDGMAEDKIAKTYWIFFVDGRAIDGPIDEISVTSGQIVTAQLIEPLETVSAQA